MATALHVMLDRDERGQFLRIPPGLELAGTVASLRQEGRGFVVESTTNPNAPLLAVLATLDPIDEDFGPIEDLPPEPVDF